MKSSGSVSIVAAGVVALIGAVSSAQAAEVGKAVVRSVRGHAQYAEGGQWLELKPGQVLKPGASIRTANESQVDLFLDQNGPMVRLVENTTLGIDKLNFEATGIETVMETQLDLKSGRILGIVKKMAHNSKYEIKTPNGVAGIRGTRYRMSANSFIVLLDGTMVYVYVPPGAGGTPTPYTLAAPPAQYFAPTEGIKPAPIDLVKEVRDQFQHGPPFTPPGPPAGVPFKEPFISPGTGKPANTPP